MGTQFFYRHITDRTLTGITTLGLSGPGSNGDKGVLNIPQTQELELHDQIEFNVIPRIIRPSTTTF